MKRVLPVIAGAVSVAAIGLALADQQQPPPARKRIDFGATMDAGPRSDAAVSRIQPDPPAMFERGQWVFDLRWDKGDVYLLGVHRVELAASQFTPRAMGRFAIELYEGPTVIERVRFDFPLLGAGDGLVDAGPRGPLSFERRLATRIGVMFPATSRGTRLELWDRATDKRYPLPWPPRDTRLAADAAAATDASGRP